MSTLFPLWRCYSVRHNVLTRSLNRAKTLMRHRLIAIPLVLAGCLWPTDPRLDAAVRVPEALTAETYGAGAVTWAEFQIPVTITNTGRTGMRFHGCGSFSIEDVVPGQTVWRPVCALFDGVNDVVRPGETLEWIVPVSAALSGPGGPEWDAESLEGTYRLRLEFGDESGDRLTARTSNTFVLRAE
jgi:hypothetical protein